MAILQAENLSFTYSNQEKPALSQVFFSTEPGEFVTLCGSSGCGKSTLLRQLKPMLAPAGRKEGSLLFNGKELSSLPQREQCENIGFVLQNPDSQIVTDKVWHELAFGLESLGYQTAEIRARVAEMASFFGIQSWFHAKTAELSGGQKQLLNLASVMVMQPSVLVLDEPTSQLDPIAAREFLETVAKINREIGTTIILSEHRLEETLTLCGRVIVLEDGSILADGSPRRVGEQLYREKHPMFSALPTPMQVYFKLGGGGISPVTVGEGKEWLEGMCQKKDVINKPKQIERPKKEPVISLEELWFRYEKKLPDVLKGLSFTVNRGEIYALVGGNGTGKTTVLSMAAALYKPYRGKVRVLGRVSMLPQNPQLLFSRQTVEEELLEMLPEQGIEPGEQEGLQALSWVVSVCELVPLLNRHPYDLSGGEQQRLGLSKVLLTNPDIILLDEPTKGMDAIFKERLGQLLSALRQSGKTVVMVSHDIEFCARYADVCGMIFDGSVVSEGSPRSFFAGKSFYTTAANRMARSTLPGAVLAEDIIRALGGESVLDEPLTKEV